MKTEKAQNDIPVPLALLALAGFGGGYLYLTQLRFHMDLLNLVVREINAHSSFWWISSFCIVMNLAVIAIFFKRAVGLERQGSKLAVLEGKSRKIKVGKAEMLALAIGIAVYFAMTKQVVHAMAPIFIRLLSEKTVSWTKLFLSFNFALSSFLAARLVLRLGGFLRFSVSGSHKLEIPEIENGDLVLGTTTGELTHGNEAKDEEWVKIPSRGINGGIFISGSVGSGKTQGTILRYLDQLIKNKGGCPAILAIDPKGMFLKDAERIIRRAGLGHLIVKISLKGNESFNPVYMEMLEASQNQSPFPTTIRRMRFHKWRIHYGTVRN